MKAILFFLLILNIYADNAERVWRFFKDRGFTDAGAGGFMGNIDKESGCEPRKMQYSKMKDVGMGLDEYVSRTNSRSYSRKKFTTDKVGFGLCQWTSKPRKEKLYDRCVGKIESLSCQLDHLEDELFYWSSYANRYKEMISILRKSNNLRECVKVVAQTFEKCAKCDQDSEINDRKKRAKKYCKRFTGRDEC
jgi:hypothetical protein